MATSIFDRKEYQPNNNDLERVLKSCFVVWHNLLDFFYQNHDVIETNWKFYSKNSGWCLKVNNEKGKNLAYLLPNDDYFMVCINMSESVRTRVLSLNLTEQNRKLIEDAKVYKEGISVLFRITFANDLKDIETVLNFKG